MAWQDLRQTHGDDVIVVTRRNRDAVSLNLAAREVLREEGLIQGKDVSLTAVDRDSDLAQLPIAQRGPHPLRRDSSPAPDSERHPGECRKICARSRRIGSPYRSVSTMAV